MALTDHRVKILAALLSANGGELTSHDIWRRSGVGIGDAYPIIFAFERNGVVEGRWPAVVMSGTPRHKLYRLTPEGERVARQVIA